MIRYVEGDLLSSNAEALVNAVNEVGVMGKGLALLFRQAFPENTQQYAAACRAGRVCVGSMLVVPVTTATGPRLIINFPTKKHWMSPSQLNWVQDGLRDLSRVLRERQVRSVAMPALGCGLGGLAWSQVQPAIEQALGDLFDIDIAVFLPHG